MGQTAVNMRGSRTACYSFIHLTRLLAIYCLKQSQFTTFRPYLCSSCRAVVFIRTAICHLAHCTIPCSHSQTLASLSVSANPGRAFWRLSKRCTSLYLHRYRPYWLLHTSLFRVGALRELLSDLTLLNTHKLTMAEGGSALSQPDSVAGTKRKRGSETKFYVVRTGHHPGIYYNWDDCLKEVKGYKKAECEHC